jgi:hypothetical protein
MMRMKLRRNETKSHPARRMLIAAGAVGAAAEGVRRFRHRRPSEQMEH